MNMHQGRLVDFKFEVTKAFIRDPLARQLDEARRLQEEAKREDSVMMNDKLEWVAPAGIIVSVSRM